MSSKKPPDQLDLFTPMPATDCELADPCLLNVPPYPKTAAGSDRAFAESVRAYGVLTPVLVVPEEDGGRTIVSGARRAAAAAAAGQLVPVRVLPTSRIEALCAAFNADNHVQQLSTIERGWRFRVLLEAAEEAGIRVTVGWVKDRLGVSQGTAHGLLSVARRLPPERVRMLAAKAGVAPARVQSLPFHAAVRLSQQEDEDAVSALRERLLPTPESGPASGRWWARACAWLWGVVLWLVGGTSRCGPAA